MGAIFITLILIFKKIPQTSDSVMESMGTELEKWTLRRVYWSISSKNIRFTLIASMRIKS